jgi:hypothetical protein
VYLGVQAVLIIFAYFFYIETKGYTIEEVSRLFDGERAEAHELAAHDDAESVHDEDGKDKVETVEDRGRP